MVDSVLDISLKYVIGFTKEKTSEDKGGYKGKRVGLKNGEVFLGRV